LKLIAYSAAQMTGRHLLRGLFLGLAALGAPTLAQAAPVFADKNATATVRIAPGANVRKLRDLNFAWLTVTGPGTAIIDPNSEIMTTTGGVLHAAATPFAALFEAVSPAKAVVIIRIPRNPITVTRVGGTETMTVSNWTLSGNSRRNTVAHEQFDFKVGGTLTVGANQAEGLYVGNFDVEIQFP
jgi:hypothetical protein